MPKEYVDYLRHILDECESLYKVAEKCSDKDDLTNDEVLKRAVVRSLEVIREATKNIPADTKLKWPNVQWKNMAGMRDRLIHDYIGIDYSIVWDVLKNHIPSLRQQVAEAIGSS